MQKRPKNAIGTAAAPEVKTEPATATAQPHPDLLRAKIYNFSPEQQESARAELLAMILKSVTGMDASGLQDVAQFIEICENNAGCITPAEEFITDLVMTHSGYSLTPDWAADTLARFRENFGIAVNVAGRFATRYPELVKPPTSGVGRPAL